MAPARGVLGGLGEELGVGRELLLTPVGGPVGPVGPAEVQPHAPEEAAVVGDVVGPQGLVALVADLRQGRRAAFRGVGADVLEVLETGRRRQQERRGVGPLDRDALVGDGDPAAVAEHAQARLEAQAVVLDLARQRERIGGDGPGLRRLVRAVHLQREADASAPVGAEADDDDLIGIAREDLPPIGDVADAIGHARDGRVQVQLAAVVGRPPRGRGSAAAGRRRAGRPSVGPDR